MESIVPGPPMLMNSQTGDMLVNEIGPRLASLVPHSVVPIGTEDLEELYQDGIAIAAKLLTRCVETGKVVTPGNIAYYTVRLLKAGRRSTGCTATDVMAPMTQIKGRAQVISTDQPLSIDQDEPMTLAYILAVDRDDPATEALRNLAWEELHDRLSPRELSVVSALAEGRGLSDTARKLGVSPSSMSTARASLARRIREEWGTDAVAESVRQPNWNGGLRADRERRASRYETRNG